MKRWVSWVLALAMVTMTLLPASAEAVPQSATPETAVAQEVQTEDNQEAITGTYGVLSYTVNDDGTSCSITDCDTSAEGELEIPEEIDGYKVTSIGARAFYYCRSLTGITIPEGVTEIGEGTFFGCSSITSITIPESVIKIGNSAFGGCSSLTSVTIPEGVTKIDTYTFSDCSSLTSITIPEGVTEIGYRAFNRCSSIASITIPDSVTSIGEYVFEDCSSLTSITIPEGVTMIRRYTFSGCSSLASITIPEGITNIGEKAFNGCDKLKNVYYAGTQEAKDAISVGDTNDELLNATWHYNSTGPEVLPDVEVSQTAKVRYFNSWDAEKRLLTGIIMWTGLAPQ